LDFYNLGPVNWWETQCYYHALAMLGREGLIICYPTSPYVCLGLHDDLEQEINQDYCKSKEIPLLRRETGGGVVYLDDKQIFYQLVLRRDNPILPWKREKFYQRFLKPAISVYRKLGMPAELKTPADIIVDGCKCSGNAAGDIGKAVAFVGNILLDFDFATMSQVLRVPTAAFHYYLYKAMLTNMATIKDYLGSCPDYNELIGLLIKEFTNVFGELHLKSLDKELIDMADKFKEKLTSMEWLSLPGRRYSKRSVKIAEGVYLKEERMSTGDNSVVLVNNGLVEEVHVKKSTDNEKFVPGYSKCRWAFIDSLS